jgi:hypothetical protein
MSVAQEVRGLSNTAVRRWMATHTGSQVSFTVIPQNGAPSFSVVGVATPDAEGVMCLALPGGGLQPVPCAGFGFADPVVLLAAAPSSRAPSPDPRSGVDQLASILGGQAEVAAEARAQRETMLGQQQAAAAEAGRERAMLLASQQDAASEAGRERAMLLASQQSAASEAGRERAMLLTSQQGAAVAAAEERAGMRAAQEEAAAAAAIERGSIMAAQTSAAAAATVERTALLAEARAASQRAEAREEAAAQDRREIRASLAAQTDAIRRMVDALAASPSPRAPSGQGSPLLFPESEGGFSHPPPLGREPPARVGTRSAPYELSPSPVAQATVDELLLGRERTTWSSHAVPPQELLFGARERDVLRALPEYAFLKEDGAAGTWKRALRHIVGQVVVLEHGGIEGWVAELATALTVHGRWLSSGQLAELHTLVELAGALHNPQAHLLAAIAEFSLLGNPLFAVQVFEQVRLTRISRPQAKQEVAAWAAGELVETRLPAIPVRLRNPQPHVASAGRGQAGGRKAKN